MRLEIRPCLAEKMGEFNTLWCCREKGHEGEHNYVVKPAPPKDRCCRTCEHLVPPSDGKRFHHSKVYPCEWKMPESYVFPASMTRGHNHEVQVLNRQQKGWMSPKDGADCPCWVRRADRGSPPASGG